MSTSEKVFQSHFLKHCDHAYRTSLTSGSGFPDSIVINKKGEVNFVELKILELGKRGDKKLGATFQLTQPAWYLRFLVAGGKRLFVAWQIEKRYGLLRITKDFVMNVDVLKYSDLLKMEEYKEYPNVRELIKEFE